MKNQLMNLKKSMDNTVLKSGTITFAEKQRILNAARGNIEKSKRYYFAPVFSFIFVASFILSIGIFVFNGSFDSEQEGSIYTKNNEASLTNSSNGNSKTDEKTEKPSSLSNITTTSINYPYIILDGYYYKKTNEDVTLEQLGGKIGEVKRTGDWTIKRSGDSNEIPPGPILAIKGKSKDIFIAAKGVVSKNGMNKAGYLVFERAEPIERVDTGTILNAKGDVQEVQIAFQNVKNKVGTLYGFNGHELLTSLVAISYEDGPVISQTYNVPQGNTNSNQQKIPGEFFVIQYKKEIKIEASRFIRPKNYETKDDKKAYENEQRKIDNWKFPTLIDSFDVNGIAWGIYNDDFHNDLVLRGTTTSYFIEITLQGDFTIDHLKKLMKNFKQV